MRQCCRSFGFGSGNQGWESRTWPRLAMLLAVALLFWCAPCFRRPERREIAGLFLFAAFAIPIFYLPAMFFDGTTHFSEGFFELFVTVMVPIIRLVSCRA